MILNAGNNGPEAAFCQQNFYDGVIVTNPFGNVVKHTIGTILVSVPGAKASVGGVGDQVNCVIALAPTVGIVPMGAVVFADDVVAVLVQNVDLLADIDLTAVAMTLQFEVLRARILTR